MNMICGFEPANPSNEGSSTDGGVPSDAGSLPGGLLAPAADLPCDSTIQSCPYKKLLKGEVIEVQWNSGIQVSYSRATIVKPHWKIGMALNDGAAGSKRPGVYLVKGKGSDSVTVKVRITENKNVSGNGMLKGMLGLLEIEGSCPTTIGEHSINAKIKSLPDSIQHAHGDVLWALEVPDLNSTIVLDNISRLEVFVVLDNPASFYNPPGVWVEALRFLCDKIGVIGLKESASVAGRVTTYCHGSHGLKYDTAGGRPAYGVGGSGGTFQLDSYIKAAKTVVNCYDQAAAIQSLSGAVGVSLTWHYLEPFGFIKPTNLIGIGSCNNPFFDTNGSTAVMPSDDPKRTAFGNHAFGGLMGNILDACAGPHTGTENKDQYCKSSIDSMTTLYSRYVSFRAGTAVDITEPGGVSGVV